MLGLCLLWRTLRLGKAPSTLEWTHNFHTEKKNFFFEKGYHVIHTAFEPCYTDKIGLELLIFPPLPLKCQGYKHAPLCWLFIQNSIILSENWDPGMRGALPSFGVETFPLLTRGNCFRGT